MEQYCYIIMAAVCAVTAFVTMLCRYAEHNKANELTMKENPLQVKWVAATIFSAALVGSAFILAVWYWPGLEATVGTLPLMLIGCLLEAMVTVYVTIGFNEGLSQVIHLLNQRVKKVKEAVTSPEFQELKDNTAALSEMIKSQNEVIAELKGRLGL